MYKMCLTIDGITHCFDIPALVNIDPKPPDPNFPELELAIAVLQLVEKVKPVVRETELTRAITEASNRFIQHVQRELPKGVELTRVGEETQRRAA